VTDAVWRDARVAAAFSEMRSARVPESRTQLELLLRVLRALVPAPRRVLDLGAGDGVLLAAVLEAFPESTGVAVDFSPEMLARARERLQPLGRAQVMGADLADPGWRERVQGPFDAIISAFAIHHLPDARSARSTPSSTSSSLRAGPSSTSSTSRARRPSSRRSPTRP
jgi:tRNA (cmo5U34)-methyltransferase